MPRAPQQLSRALQSKKIQVQARRDEFVPSEATRIYHHELHKKYIRKSSIVLLDTEDGLLEGHTACAAYLHKKVQELLCHPAELNSDAQNSLLSLVNPVFTDKDNEMLDALPTPEELLKVVSSSNLNLLFIA